jgi:DNA polymerase I-like protein with 3'-5' exonuclease and polymerase domains
MSAIAIDTETTGLDLRHGCKAFMVTACDDKGKTWVWQGYVDPLERGVHWPANVIEDIANVIDPYNEYVFHNASFDLDALKGIGIDLYPNSHQVHDTMFMSHVVDSEGPHGLKYLAIRYCDILDDDEDILDETVKKARNIASRKLPDWRIAKKGDPHFPLQDQKFHKADFWLPSLIYQLHPELVPEEWKDAFKDACTEYATKDVERTMALYLFFQEVLKMEGLEEMYERERRLLPVVKRMEDRGVSLRKRALIREMSRYASESNWAEETCRKVAKKPHLNIGSNNELIETLYFELGLKPPKLTQGGNPSVDADSLQTLRKTSSEYLHGKARAKAHKFLDSLLAQKSNETALKYLKMYHRSHINWRVHSTFRQVGLSTTRFGSSSPNLQNVGNGKEDEEDQVDYVLRDVFGPLDGRIWYPLDYSQLQLRIFAYASQEESLIQAFLDGYDYHEFVASKLFDIDLKKEKPSKIQRRIAKNVNFALIFGGGKWKVDQTAGMPGAYDMFQGLFPNVADFMREVSRQVKRQGYVETMYGYRLQVSQSKPYVGVNYIVQGTEGDIVKNAMIECDKYLQDNPKYQGHITLQVHDELVFEFEKDPPLKVIKKLKSIMEKAGSDLGMITPVEASRVKRKWSEKEDIAV